MNDTYEWYDLNANEGPEEHFQQTTKDFGCLQRDIHINSNPHRPYDSRGPANGEVQILFPKY